MVQSPNCKVFYKDRFDGMRLKFACESYNPTFCEDYAAKLRRRHNIVQVVYQGQALSSDQLQAWRRNGR